MVCHCQGSNHFRRLLVDHWLCTRTSISKNCTPKTCQTSLLVGLTLRLSERRTNSLIFLKSLLKKKIGLFLDLRFDICSRIQVKSRKGDFTFRTSNFLQWPRTCRYLIGDSVRKVTQLRSISRIGLNLAQKFSPFTRGFLGAPNALCDTSSVVSLGPH